MERMTTGNQPGEIAERLGRSLDDVRRRREYHWAPEPERTLLAIARSTVQLLPTSSHFRLHLANELHAEARNMQGGGELIRKFNEMGLRPKLGSC